jgi:acyl-CoA reductase-like NAD-dependent aldehyde dehydrogenase
MAITDNAVHSLLIDGEEVAAARSRTVVDPATGEPLAEVADGSAEDADRAVAAARAAFRRGDWSRITPGERAAVVDRMADLLEERADEFARVESRNTGKPLKFSSAFDLPLSIDNLRFFAAAARNLEGKASGESSASPATTRRSRWPTTRATGWPRPPGPGTCSAPSARRESWRPVRSGSTSTSPSARRCRMAG